METNVKERLVIPELPSIREVQQIMTYMPVAGYNSAGVAKFDSTSFLIEQDGRVRLRRNPLRAIVDISVDATTGIGLITYDDGTTNTLNFPVCHNDDLLISNSIITIEFDENSFIQQDDNFLFAVSNSVLMTNNDNYIVQLSRFANDGYVTSNDSIIKGTDGSLLLISTARYKGKLHILAKNYTSINDRLQFTDDGHVQVSVEPTRDLDIVRLKELNERLATVYKLKGSITYEKLIADGPSKNTLGYVYNISNSFTTNEMFIDNIGETYGAGTNVVVVEVNEAYFFDVLASFADLSKYYEKQNQVFIESGLVRVGNDLDENERPLNYTTIEPTSLRTVNWMYNSYAALQSQTYTREDGLKDIPSVRLGYTRLMPTNTTDSVYLKLPNKDGTLATLDDVDGSIIIINEADYPNANGYVEPFPNMSFRAFMAIDSALMNGKGVFYKPFGGGICPIISGEFGYSILVDNTLYTYRPNVVDEAVTYTEIDLTNYYPKKENVGIDYNGVIVYHNTDGVVSGTKFEGKQITSTNYSTGETGVLKIPQNKNGTLALAEDVENKVDKITINDSVPAVYVINTDNTPTTARLDFLDKATFNAIPRRNESLNIFLPNPPEEDTDSTNKGYVDDKFKWVQLASGEVTEEDITEAGEEGVTAIILTVPDNFDISTFSEINFRISFPKPPTGLNTLEMGLRINTGINLTQSNITFLGVQSLSLSPNSGVSLELESHFSITGYWDKYNREFIQGTYIKNGYGGSWGYPTNINGWVFVNPALQRLMASYKYWKIDNNNNKIPAGTTVKMYGR